MSAAADLPRAAASTATVRAASAEDAETLAAVAAVTFGLACPPSMTRERVKAFVAEVLSPARFAGYLADPERHLLLAEGEGKALGYVMLVSGEPGDADVRSAIRLRPTVELSKIYVLPEAHGTGAAALLMARGLDWAAGTGAAGVWLGVNQQNERAQRFYAKSGFERVGTKRFLVGGVFEDDYVMEHALAPHP
ncbi:GNAT family N-acetyltransferase [Terrabacter sp. BE26]|uniref:GNAT family N-acetyltransferase n=1 Tax=Terrabacter sp. BE26 TaxID=2898152 RepID=UPI0035BE247F